LPPVCLVLKAKHKLSV